MTGDQHDTGTCLRSQCRAGPCSSPTPQPALPLSSARWLQQLQGPRAGCHLVPHQCWACQRSGKKSLEGLFSVGYTQKATAHSSKSSKQPLFFLILRHFLEAGWTRILAPPPHCKEPRLSHLLFEVQEQTQVKCFQWCLAPSKSWAHIPGYPPAIIIISQIAT